MAIPYNSNYDVTIPFSDTCAQFNLTLAGGPLSYEVPGPETSKYSVRFGYGDSTSNVFVQLNGALEIPVPDTVNDRQYCELKPGYDGSQRYVQGGDTLWFSTPDASAYASISLRQLQG